MPVPTSVLHVLETNNVAYQVKASTPSQKHINDSKDRCYVQSMLLQDSQGTVQILFPEDAMIDLTEIKAEFGRNLEALPSEELIGILAAGDLNNIPAIPAWQNMPTIVDASLLRFKTLLLDTGVNHEMLELKIGDFEAMVRTCNVGEFAKLAPQVPTTLHADKEQIVTSIKTFTELRIRKRLAETLELPPLPETAQRIIKLRADPEADISDLTGIVELDPSLASQVVSWASSPFYSAPGKIRSVHDAIIRVLGFDMVLNLALGLALGKSISKQSMNNEQLNDYWYQAVCTAAAVEGLVTSIPREHRPGFGMAYLSGLLHNFGQLIVAEVFPPYFANIDRHRRANAHLDQAQIEQSLIGVSNCQICAWLLKAWNMPDEVVNGVRYQNDPEFNEEHATYAKLIYLARHLLANQNPVFGMHKSIDPAIFKHIHLDQETAESAIEKVIRSADDLKTIAKQMQS